ncbi:ThiF family adenylyltransferase [Alteribacter aurantiacus]|uniref:ThiF family adenylyltransferase n=1 Tax=Alteribacter aurantiacus TaxID=254410 RepID=UPI000403D28F|nr:ThiF family adenylyltransferase [Alteribacter aurantiacus]
MTNRYSRQVLFQPIGEAGQVELSKKRVFIVGMGALGTVLATHLVRSGIGYVGFADRDYVERSNLQRQTLFDEDDVNHALPKAVAAEKKLKRINSEVQVKGHIANITKDNILTYVKGSDVILDGTDNFETRFLLNDAAFKLGIPYVYGGAVSSRGMQATFIPGMTPCLRCMVDPGSGKGQTCDRIGVLSPAVDIAASYQVMETIKLLTGHKKDVRRTLLSFDVWRNDRLEIKMKQAHDCKTCVHHDYPSLMDSETQVTVLCGRDTVQIIGEERIDLSKWAKKLRTLGDIELTPFLLRIKLADNKVIVLFPDGRVLIQGTQDPEEAKVLYAKYISC